MGWNASDTRPLTFDGCRVPEENLLGPRGAGFKQFLHILDIGRIGVAAMGVGLAQGALDEALKYAKERRAFGQPISKFQAIQGKLADMATEIEAGRLLTYKAAWLKDQGKNFSLTAAQAKLKTGRLAVRATEEAVQIHGGYGYIEEYPVCRFYRDAKILTIGEGTDEVQQMVIARALGRLRRALALWALLFAVYAAGGAAAHLSTAERRQLHVIAGIADHAHARTPRATSASPPGSGCSPPRPTRSAGAWRSQLWLAALTALGFVAALRAGRRLVPEPWATARRAGRRALAARGGRRDDDHRLRRGRRCDRRRGGDRAVGPRGAAAAADRLGRRAARRAALARLRLCAPGLVVLRCDVPLDAPAQPRAGGPRRRGDRAVLDRRSTCRSTTGCSAA